jgi:hypothetical protein
VFKPGQHWESRRDLADDATWDTDPLRCLHVCFMRRSSADGGAVRMNLDESGRYDRGPLGALKQIVRPRRARDGGKWKREWYARGERVTVDATPFLDS